MHQVSNNASGFIAQSIVGRVTRRGLERMIDCNKGLKSSVPIELHFLLFNPMNLGGRVVGSLA
jgi:hypothetical protein